MPTEAIVKETIIYEQPLNEPMRICLRLEHLFNQFKQHINQSNQDSSKLAVSALIKSLDVISRPDLKSKFTQMLTQQATTLTQLEQFSQVDPKRLQNILGQLDQLISSFHGRKGRIGESLRTNEFLNQIRLRHNNPGGLCAYSTPAYTLWLKKSAKERKKDLEMWASEFSELQRIVDLTLFLTRNSTEACQVIAKDGFYQQNLDPSLPCEIIRIETHTAYNVFPEFSVGRHRLAIRFLEPNYQDNGRSIQTDNDIAFELSCCRI